MNQTATITIVKTEPKELVEGGEFERTMNTGSESHKQKGYRSKADRLKNDLGATWIYDTEGHVHMKSQLKAL